MDKETIRKNLESISLVYERAGITGELAGIAVDADEEEFTVFVDMFKVLSGSRGDMDDMEYQRFFFGWAKKFSEDFRACLTSDAAAYFQQHDVWIVSYAAGYDDIADPNRMTKLLFETAFGQVLRRRAAGMQ